jgi:ABC-type multidrug transport system ATPase subunit
MTEIGVARSTVVEAHHERHLAALVSRPVFALSGVTRHWGRKERRWAVLRDVNLELAPGTAMCVTGANGAGKTTLLRIAAGVLAPDHGRVRLDGLTPDGDWREYHRRIGFLSAGDRGLYARLSVRGHLEHWLALSLVPRSERRERLVNTLDRFGLLGLADRRVDRLSLGQRQRLRLGLAFSHGPLLMLLDEPHNSLDSDGQASLAAAVDEVRERGGAILCCAPAGERRPELFDRWAEIEDGALCQR